MNKDITALAAIFATSGVIHLAKPEVYEPIMPRMVPAHREVIYASGVAELLCAAGLLVPATRRPAGYASAALLVAVFPANVQMSVAHGQRAQRRGDPASRASFAATLARLPLQVPMIRTALRAAGR